MSSIRVAVPLFRGKRRFHLEKGRRWSVAEHIVLASLAERPRSAAELAREGQMHHRLALEMLIRLMKAGWVELRPDGRGTVFQASPAGIAAAGRAELPVVARPLSRWMNFVVDRITGSIFRPREMPFLHRNAVQERAEREPIVWLEPRKLEAQFEIQDLVSHLFQEDETFVALDPAGDRLMERFGLVLVRGGTVEGLPERAPAALTDAIRQAAASHRSSNAGRPPTPDPRPAADAGPALLPKRPLTLTADDLIVGAQENEEALRALLGDARQRVIIHSTFVSAAAFARLKPDLFAAAQRGARVDLLWGEGDDPRSSGRTRAAVTQIRAELARTGEDELIRLHPFSTRSHAKFTIADRQGKAPVALIGSCNWLSSGMQLIEAAVRLRDAAIVADLLFQAAELSCGRDGHWTEITSELAAYAAQLAKHARTDVKPLQPFARLVLAPAHKALVLQAKAQAEARIFVTSHRLSIAARQAVFIPLGRSAADEAGGGFETRLFYGHEPEAIADALTPLGNKVLSIGGVVVSIFLIIITLVENARNYLGDADRMHQSALAISELYNRFQALTIEQADAERLTFNDLYSEALKLIPVDHKDIDYKRFMIRSSADLGISGFRYASLVLDYGLRWFWEFSLYLALILIPLIALAIFLLTR